MPQRGLRGKGWGGRDARALVAGQGLLVEVEVVLAGDELAHLICPRDDQEDPRGVVEVVRGDAPAVVGHGDGNRSLQVVRSQLGATAPEELLEEELS